jgi:hypothetical protein
MAPETTSHPTPAATRGFSLTPQQVAFFDTFGFVKLPGLFRSEIGDITAAFEEVFAATDEPMVLSNNPYHQSRNPQFEDKPRLTVPLFIEQNETLGRLRTDPRVVGIAESLLGPDFEYAHSDGNLFFCDVYWHLDAFGSPIHQRHIKLYFYLDALRHDSGALRVIPGTGDLGGSYVTAIRGLFNDPDHARSTLGLELDEVPSWTLEVDPGDVLVGNYRTMHATFGGGPRRRLFTINFKEPLPAT